ncbi:MULTISPECIES: 30S ribosomal protein S3 [Methanosarcina]|uniref:Small ribosomal subunit protein uS3 n=4 Tax=Methanosarcina mazei TaxID=2209 RepID=RS3_METMA|nr:MULTISPECIES: 30S ribosomal protein S3 [Methanosarcina]Q8PV44.1 RecName: Full=Small ribosomal subunit protein uS3; AltName: Full=30S ribosomal protein S3 [Methanosarcina mazei Go1]AAM31826.1 SSU ribosomal protein S3P [Methanosarcina mazei Go1]AKB65750.1 SSU ribosomal protein S3e (S3p) [Methanosarcina mazei S-6]AKB71781.1 SSU ribosomal protein S3e (S3p) [Methanosarcina mazei C16]KKG11825.1 30S ribosomal protein S3 [Methanosarcina mazei]KKG68611.1 30S ribosomal protein S3 [Methanosarcina maz
MAIEKKFVNDGYVKASMDEYFAEQLNRAGYGGMELNRTPMGTQIIIYSEKPGMVIGKAGKVIRKLTRDVATKYNLENPQIDAQEVKKPELNAQMMASRLAASIERGWYFRKAGHNTIRAVMNAGALGCEVVISGKLTGARSRVEKFVDGYIKHSGHPVEEVVDEGFAVAIKKLGTLGCKVRIIQPGVVLPDSYKVRESVEIEEPAEKPAEKQVEKPAVAPKKEAAKAKAPAPAAAPEPAPTEEPEVAEPEEAEEAQVEASEDFEEAELIYVEGSEEVRRQVNGVWQHKHESYDYWHPMARVHKEAKE